MTQHDTEVATLRALVAAYGLDPPAARALLDETAIGPGDFTSTRTQSLFAALSATMRDGAPLDMVALTRRTRGQCPAPLVLDVTSSTDAWGPERAKSRLSALREITRRRHLGEKLRGLQALVDAPGSLGALLGEVERVLREVGAESGGGASTLDGSMFSVIERLEAVQEGRRESTLATGIDALDYAIGGLQPTLTIVGALPGIGKSALFAAIARNLAARGVSVGVLSLEDEREWLVERILAEAASVPIFVLGNKPLAKSQMGRVGESAEGVHALLRHIMVDDRPAMTPAEIVASARSMVARGCKAILVDHLGEIRLGRTDRHDLDVLEALQDLRGLAKTYRVPVVVACHLRRREGLNVDTVPRLTDFAFSAAIERCARVALGLFRPRVEAGQPEQLGVEVMKQTKGPRDFNFKLNVGALYGTVQATPVSSAMREKFGGWRDE